MKNIVIYISVIAIILAGGIYLLYKPQTPKNQKNLDNFAQCLSDKKIIMYGAYWCPHCQAQKKLFGDSVEKITYVECTTNANLCTEKGVNGFPTWIDSAGHKYEGEQSLETLAKITGCQLP